VNQRGGVAGTVWSVDDFIVLIRNAQ
jgi:hypothetical protein